MERVIHTIVGGGNRFNDLAVLWFKRPQGMASDGAASFEGFDSLTGFRQRQFLDAGTDVSVIETAFTHALVSSEPTPGPADALRWVAELSGVLDTFAAKRAFASEFTTWLTENRSSSLSAWQKANEDEFKGRDSKVLASAIRLAFHTPSIIVERSPPSLESIASLVSKGSSAALGAFLGLHIASEASPIFLCITVPAGMLICSTAAAIAEALHFGLRHRVLTWLLNADKRQRAASATRTLEALFTNSERVSRGDGGNSGSRDSGA